MIIDFNTDFFFKDRSIPICPPSIQQLAADNRDASSNYLIQAEELFSSHQIQQKLDHLEIY